MFSKRVYMLDISRDKVPTMGTLRLIVDMLEQAGYNQFQLYMEHTFAYTRHREIWKDADPLTPSEIR
ncbi:MAG: glycoside hydrolase, partial [Kiritimatiellae bacterium]|nr:glycoside hydrolase [Kiritimatiellia bacterium]